MRLATGDALLDELELALELRELEPELEAELELEPLELPELLERDRLREPELLSLKEKDTTKRALQHQGM